MQNDFADPTGSLYVTEGEKVVPYVNDEIGRARDAGAFVVYTQDWHPPDHAALREGRRRLARPLRPRNLGR